MTSGYRHTMTSTRVTSTYRRRRSRVRRRLELHDVRVRPLGARESPHGRAQRAARFDDKSNPRVATRVRAFTCIYSARSTGPFEHFCCPVVGHGPSGERGASLHIVCALDQGYSFLEPLPGSRWNMASHICVTTRRGGAKSRTGAYLFGSMSYTGVPRNPSRSDRKLKCPSPSIGSRPETMDSRQRHPALRNRHETARDGRVMLCKAMDSYFRSQLYSFTIKK